MMIETRACLALIPALILMLAVSALAAAIAGDEIVVYVDGNKMNFPDQKPLINNDNRTLVPVRFVSEALGAEVDWDGTKQQVSVKHNTKNILLQIGQKRPGSMRTK